MSKLSTLALSAASPRQQLSPVARKRRKLLEQIELQQQAAEAAITGNQFAQEIQRWQRVEGTADKQLVTVKKPVRPWWWKNEVGKVHALVASGQPHHGTGDWQDLDRSGRDGRTSCYAGNPA